MNECQRPVVDDGIRITCHLPYSLDPLDLHQAFPARYPHFLESAAQGTATARYDILFAFPGDTLALSHNGSLSRAGNEVSHDSFLAALDAWWQMEYVPHTEYELPFTGGWFLYLGYELAGEIEPSLGLAPAQKTVALATRFPAAIIRDHDKQQLVFVCERDAALGLLPQLMADIAVPLPALAHRPALMQTTEEPEDLFLSGVDRVREYIRAGDVFQVNLSRRWHAAFEEQIDPAQLYRGLRAANPAPFAGLATLPDFTVVSSSPERLVEVRGGVVRTRPIAGTCPRSEDRAQDARLAAELLRHPKERAEHIMLIDLERNDLGRICESGSVEVSELMTLETYRYVHHIVSEVKGRMRSDTTPGKVIKAVFPGGTITGCPKVRCMQLIAELEQAERGAYTGSMGYLNRDGSLDLNILIRTLTVHDQEVVFRAGAGIVADSLPERELEETRAKARGLLLSLA